MRRLLVSSLLLLVGGAGCTAAGSLDSSTHVVTYKVGGTARTADITVARFDGQTMQHAGVDVPLHNGKTGADGLVMPGYRSGAFLYISAQNNGATGSITCEIWVDGVRVVSNGSVGGYTIADCSGRL